MTRPAVDITGKRFGKLVAVHYVGKRLWDCICDCGNRKSIDGGSLRDGGTRSCGCLLRESSRRTALSIKYRPGRPRCSSEFQIRDTRAFHQYKCNAKDKGRIWELSREQFDFLIHNSCHYCGQSPDLQKYRRNGIDRKDNSLGYTEANVVSCCTQCNRIKRGIPYETFMAFIIRVSEFRATSRESIH